MRRPLVNVIAIILIVACWQACAPVHGYPASSRRSLTELASARRRDAQLIAGSDFLNMYIGTTASPTVRSRRYPLPRSEYRNRLYHERRAPPPSPDRMSNYDTHPRDADPRENFTENQEPVERLSGLVRSQDRHNYNSKTQGNVKVSRTEEVSRGVRRFDNNRPVDSPSSVSEKRGTAEDDSDFGARTVPRTGGIVLPTSSTSESAMTIEEFTDSLVFHNDDVRQNNPVSYRDSNESDAIADVSDNRNPSGIVVESTKNDFSVPVIDTKIVSVSPRFSVSSSVHKITSKSQRRSGNLRQATTTKAGLTSTRYSLTSQIDQDVTEGIQDSQFTTSDVSLPTTESYSFSTDDEASTITPSIDTETTTEKNVDWSTKSEDVTSVFADETHDRSTTVITQPSTTETPPEDAPMQPSNPTETISQISVRVSSSVAQSPSNSQSQYLKPNLIKSTSFNTILEEPLSAEEPLKYDAKDPESNLKLNTASLVTDEQPPATSIQRSDFSVEESVPSEVTSHPLPLYSSYSSSYYQSPETSPDPQNVPVSYQTSIRSAVSGSHVQYFSKPPSYRRLSGSLRRSGLEATSIDATVVEAIPERYAAQSIPRVSIQRSSATISHSLSKEPVSFAESIQRSVIANQDEQTETRSITSRGQIHQDKTDFGLEQEKNIDEQRADRGRKSFQLRESMQKSYNQPERLFEEQDQNYEEAEKQYEVPEKAYGEPSKVYSEPAKVYSEPAKVYGEPSKVYSEPAKVYSEPSKVYSEPAKVYSEPAKVYSEPSKIYGQPAKNYGEPAKNYGRPEQNYEVDESINLMTNGRAHGVQATTKSAPSQVDTALKVFDTRQQDPNHKVGYVVEGRDFRKYRVEERTSDGFIVGEYGVVSHDGGNLRGVRYTADGTINPRLIYDTLIKFLSL